MAIPWKFDDSKHKYIAVDLISETYDAAVTKLDEVANEINSFESQITQRFTDEKTALDTHMEEMDTELHSEIDAMNAALDTMRTETSAAIATILGDAENLDQRLDDALSNLNTTMNSRFETIESDLESFQDEITAKADEAVAAANAAASKEYVDSSVSSLRQNLTEIIATQRSEVDEATAELSSRITDLDGRMTSGFTGLDNRIDDLTADIAMEATRLDARIDRLRTEISENIQEVYAYVNSMSYLQNLNDSMTALSDDGYSVTKDLSSYGIESGYYDTTGRSFYEIDFTEASSVILDDMDDTRSIVLAVPTVVTEQNTSGVGNPMKFVINMPVLMQLERAFWTDEADDDSGEIVNWHYRLLPVLENADTPFFVKTQSEYTTERGTIQIEQEATYTITDTDTGEECMLTLNWTGTAIYSGRTLTLTPISVTIDSGDLISQGWQVKLLGDTSAAGTANFKVKSSN